MTERKLDIQLSVVICTHNRSVLALDCVDALLRNPGADALDIIVVDNASSSEEHARLLAGVQWPARLIEQPTPGLSHARNIGASVARGAWLAYLDDDALPYPDWAERALTLVNESPENVGLIGGAVLPQWPRDIRDDSVQPDRLGSRWRTLLSLIEAERTEPGSPVPDIVACNMLIRRELLTELGGFPTELGRTPGSLLGGEEIAVVRKVAARGSRVLFDSQLRVHHRIHAERLGTDWVRRRAHAEGELLWKCSPSAKTAAKVVLSIPYLALVSRLRAMRTGTPQDYDHHVRLWNNLGFVKSAMRSVAPSRHRSGTAE
jgi:GT2 family glycosyltransferase